MAAPNPTRRLAAIAAAAAALIALTGCTSASGEPFGGMEKAGGTLTPAEACGTVDAFAANMPGNVEQDPEAARDAVDRLEGAAPSELRGTLRGFSEVLDDHARGHAPIEAVEGRLTGVVSQCEGMPGGN